MNQAENSEIKTLKFDIGYLFACIPFFKADHPISALDCVSIGDGWMGASNGAAMVIVERDIFKGCDYLLSGDDVCALYKHILSTQAINDDCFVDGFELRIVSDTEAIAVININQGEYEHLIDLMGYDRVDFKKVDIAEPDTVTLMAMQMPYFNPDLLSLFSKSGSCFAGNPIDFLRIIPTGLNSPIYVEMTNYMHGLLMPATLGGDSLNFLKKEIDL